MRTWPDRIEMIRNMPRHEGVEVGTFRGDFAEAILSTGVEKLHLVDPWTFYPEYGADSCNQSNEEQEKIYQLVRLRFRECLKNGRVHIHRRFSVDAVLEFMDAPVPWVYLDANHQFDAVLTDLRAWEQVILPGGFLMGHDYGEFPESKSINCDVRGAVEKFCKESDWKLIGLTTEQYSASFCLQRQ